MSSTKPKAHFTLADFNPTTGDPLPDDSGAMAQALSLRLAAMQKIYVLSPQHRACFSAFDKVRNLGQATKGQRQYGIRNAAASGSGKTTAAERYRDYVLSKGEHGPGDEPVVIIPLDRACTSRRLWASVCDYFGDGYTAASKTEETLRKRAYKCLQEFNVQLLIIDEVQHLSFRSSERNDVTDSLKRTLDDGIVPLVFLGTEAARTLLVNNIQLSMRLLPPCDLRKLDPKEEADRAEFSGFLRRYDQRMLDDNLVSRLSGFDDARIVASMLDVSSGVIGRAVSLIRMAYSRSFCRNADFVELCDLDAATDEWAVAQGLVKRNPFRARVR